MLRALECTSVAHIAQQDRSLLQRLRPRGHQQQRNARRRLHTKEGAQVLQGRRCAALGLALPSWHWVIRRTAVATVASRCGAPTPGHPCATYPYIVGKAPWGDSRVLQRAKRFCKSICSPQKNLKWSRSLPMQKLGARCLNSFTTTSKQVC